MDEKTKQCVMFGVIGFNITIFAYQFLFNYPDFTFGKLMLGLVAAAGVGGLGFGIGWLMNR